MAETFIIGAGIVGISTAYYLSEHQPPETIHLVENSDVLASASGYAAGFLARDWFEPEIKEVAALSFDQHRALAEKYDGRANWGYVRSTSLDYTLPPVAGQKAAEFGRDMMSQASGKAEHKGAYTGSFPKWAHRRDGDEVKLRADDDTSAQLDPRQFSTFLLKVVRERGVHFHQPASVVSVGTDANGELASVSLQSGTDTSPATLPCTRLILTAGTWTGRVFETLFGGSAGIADRGLPISNLAGHSLLVREPGTPDTVPPKDTEGFHVYALFTLGGPLKFRISLFGRADGSIYMAGWNSKEIAVPATAAESVPYPEELDGLMKAGQLVMGIGAAEGDALQVVRRGLCHRPLTPWGHTLLLRLPDERLGSIKTKPAAAGGVFVAAGHGAWGISQGPGTGMVLAELAQGRPLSADISHLGFH